MKRREFLMAAGGVTGGAAVASGPAAARGAEASPSPTPTPGSSPTGTTAGTPSGGGTVTVEVGPGGDFVFEPGTDEPLYIKPKTTVKWVWKSDNHNIVVGSQPEDANWEGTPGGENDLYNTGYTYEHTFEVTGEYHYWCQPHKPNGMVADVVVNEQGAPPGGGGARGEVELEEMGVPFQAHFVGLATALMVLVSLVYVFFVLKYGESPHTSGGQD